MAKHSVGFSYWVSGTETYDFPVDKTFLEKLQKHMEQNINASSILQHIPPLTAEFVVSVLNEPIYAQRTILLKNGKNECLYDYIINFLHDLANDVEGELDIYDRDELHIYAD